MFKPGFVNFEEIKASFFSACQSALYLFWCSFSFWISASSCVFELF